MLPRFLVALMAGSLFGLGLVISRMIDPAKVLGFLDITGNWDPSLALVMAGAIPIAAVGFRLMRGRARPPLDTRFHGPARDVVDRPLLVGAMLFGIGWGLVGYCPGPALASLGLGRSETLIFLAAMIVGMAAQRLFEPPAAADLREDPKTI